MAVLSKHAVAQEVQDAIRQVIVQNNPKERKPAVRHAGIEGIFKLTHNDTLQCYIEMCPYRYMNRLLCTRSLVFGADTMSDPGTAPSSAPRKIGRRRKKTGE